MNNKKNLIILCIFLITILTACNKQRLSPEVKNAKSENEAIAKIAADKLEVYYFHRTQRCVSCMTMGEYINKTILEYFADEMANGVIDYQEINIDLPENKDLARKFQATGSALFLNAIQNDEDHIQNVMEIWNWKSSEDGFKSALKQKIDNLLGK